MKTSAKLLLGMTAILLVTAVLSGMSNQNVYAYPGQITTTTSCSGYGYNQSSSSTCSSWNQNCANSQGGQGYGQSYGSNTCSNGNSNNHQNGGGYGNGYGNGGQYGNNGNYGNYGQYGNYGSQQTTTTTVTATVTSVSTESDTTTQVQYQTQTQVVQSPPQMYEDPMTQIVAVGLGILAAALAVGLVLSRRTVAQIPAPAVQQYSVPQVSMSSSPIKYCIRCGIAMPQTGAFCGRCGTQQ